MERLLRCCCRGGRRDDENEAALGQQYAFPRLLSCFFLFRRMFRKSLRILVEVISIPTAPTKTQ
jgi:hypothetical protein